MKNKTIITLLTLTTLFACKKQSGTVTDPPVVVPQEQITTVILTGYDVQSPANKFSFKWEDLDGDGGAVPTIDTLLLDTGKTYSCELILLNKFANPVDTVSYEIMEEKDIHQFFYYPSATLSNKVSINRTDFDNNQLPVGLKFDLLTRNSFSFTTPETGLLRIVLSHYDGIQKTTNPSPESDLDIEFPVKLGTL